MSSGVGQSSSGTMSPSLVTAIVPLVEASTIDLTPDARAVSQSTRVPSTCSLYIRCASSGSRETRPARW